MKIKKNITVKKSTIQGKGVYANRDYSKGNIVLEIDDSDVVKDHSKLSKKQWEFDCDFLANGKVILMRPPEKFINHSCDPNTYVKTIDQIRKVIARRDIKRGEEITYDCSINGDNDGIFVCHCGAHRCRGKYQGSFFKLPWSFQKEYLPYLEDWFIKEHKIELDKLFKNEQKVER